MTMKENSIFAEISIVVPTYNEKENIEILFSEIKKAMPSNIDYEIIVVDDNSPDKTWEKALELMTNTVTVIRRVNIKGLSTAILDGILFSAKKYVIVLDADLQHPPQYIPKLLAEAVEKNADVVIGSRYMKGGGIEGWSKTRLLISKGASLIAKLLLPSTRGLTDPMSGFFLVKKEIVARNREKLNPYGYKILLEILEKCEPNKVVEVPYTFKPRLYGKSKLGTKVIVEYIIHVLKLSGWRPFKFIAVGATGTIVNLATLLLLKYIASPLYLDYFFIGSAIAIEASILFNFALHETWTFKDRLYGTRIRRLVLFHLSVSPSVIAQYISAVSLRYGLSVNPIIAQLIGILIGFPINYVFSELGIWKKKV